MEYKNTQTTNKRKIIIGIIIAFSLIISFVCGYFFNTLIQGKERRNLNTILSLIEEKGIYVTQNPDGTELSDDQLLSMIVKTVLAKDSYAKYYTKEEYAEKQQKNQGNYSGLGLGFIQSNKIYSVVGNSPAENAGLRVNDVIEKVSVDNGKEVLITDYQTLSNILNSVSSQSSIDLTVNRNGEQKKFTIAKGEFSASYVKYFDDTLSVNVISDGKKTSTIKYQSEEKFNLASDTAIIKLDAFEGDAGVQFGGAMQLMKEKGKTKLILDLRGNGGGSVDILCEIAEYLVFNGGKRTNAIAYVQYKDSQDVLYTTSNKYNVKLKKTVVLADKNTASASECLIGAMLYYGRQDLDANFSTDNLVVSKDAYGNATTYGKGIMQTTYKLFTGEAIKFTTAKVYQPDFETCIQGVGITTTQSNQVDDENAIARAIEITLG